MVRFENLTHFNLRTIMNSGQCFRIFEPMPNVFDVLSMDHWVRIYYNAENNIYFFDCTIEEAESYWEPYFDLGEEDFSYQIYFDAIEASGDDFLKTAAVYGDGMRILCQNTWETIISFIISQNNNIPRIKKSIEALCRKFGKPMTKYGITRYSFPYKDDVMNIKIEDLEDLGLGYRTRYIYEVCTCDPFDFAPDNLRNITGIGPKVESCIRLFGLHQLNSYPVDTWIRQMVNEIYDGNFDTTPYKSFEGFVQQLQFYYYRSLKGR